MWSYTAPLRDMQFVIEDVLDAPAGWAATHADLDADTARQVLDEAAKFASGVLAPTNGPGDLEGCTLDADGAVRTPAGYREAYRAFVEGGWPALACDPAYGGQGLPNVLNAALYEMLPACNHAWSMYPGLLHGAYECLKAHGSEALKERYLAKIVSGEWLSTMALTEPQAGSDLGQVRTKAEPQADGSFRVTGSKIFISGADHDLTDNIVHLVLCRIAGAPAGSKGLSLVLCPKVLPDGSRNAVRVDGLEKKMGIKGSATCAVSFDGATGWLVGDENRGLAAMFVMMNAARLSVALQGLGHLEIAAQNALAYANERVQMRETIARHPVMRRTLWSLRALADGERVVAYRIAQLLDESEHHPDAAVRERAGQLVALLTPVAKAFFTHHGFHGAAQAQQVWGGYGYIHEYGIEQTVRDSRISMIYEGTNEIQAIDLVQRKLLDAGGPARLALLLAELDAEAARCADVPALADLAAALRAEAAALRDNVAALRDGAVADAEWPLRAADDALHAVAYALLAWAWAWQARAALPRAESGDAFMADKLRSARFGVQWLLPEGAQRWQRVRAARDAALPWAPA